MKAGDSYQIPVGAIHDAKVSGDKPLKVLTVYIVDKTKPLATPVHTFRLVARDALNQWKPREGLARQELPDAPAPAASAAARKLQMGRLAEGFTGHTIDADTALGWGLIDAIEAA